MMRQNKALAAVGACVLALAATTAHADKSTDEIAKYREMIADGNPSELVAAQGEELWKQKRGPKNASLEQCDLGLGAGVVKGAYAQMPRYFKDTGRVQDLETRLMSCMETLQGIKPEAVVNAKWLQGERENMAALVAYVVTESNGDKIKVDIKHPAMKRMYELGKMAFYFRSGPMDFACSTCHGETVKRIGLEGLPDLRKQEGAAACW